MSMDSLWIEKTNAKEQEPLNKDTYDIVIIGGGIAGLSCAYWLEKLESTLSILIIEKGELGDGASGRNAGFLTGGSIGYFQYLVKTYGEEQALEKWKFTTNNVDLMKKEIDLSECDYREGGTVSLYPLNEDISDLKASVELLKANDFKVELNADVFDMQGIAIKTDATFNPYLVLKKLKSLLKNTDFLFNTHVDKLSDEKVTFGNQSVVARKIILATNFGITDFLPELNIQPQRSQICYIKCDCSQMGEANYFIPQKRIYFRRHQDGLIIGGLRVIDLEKENTQVLELNEKIQTALIEQCKELFGESKLIKAWAGIMGFTRDEQPLLGELNGVYYLGGFSGHGNGYAFTMARDLVKNFVLR